MRETPPNQFRLSGPHMGRYDSFTTDGMNGAFSIPLPNRGHKVIANCIVSDGKIGSDRMPPQFRNWEHVSVHILEYGKQRVPTWEEMCLVKAIFWGEDETVIEYHPAKADYVNCHPSVLHLWKPPGDFPKPPICLV